MYFTYLTERLGFLNILFLQFRHQKDCNSILGKIMGFTCHLTLWAHLISV